MAMLLRDSEVAGNADDELQRREIRPCTLFTESNTWPSRETKPRKEPRSLAGSHEVALGSAGIIRLPVFHH